MPTLRRVLAVLLVAGACALAVPAGSASAAAPCTCTGTTQDHVKAAAAVFTGTVDEITPAVSGAQNGFSRTSTVTVERVYKGEMITTDTVDVVTTRTFGSCAGDLKKGGAYVFFVESDEGFTAPACGGTAPAAADLIAQVERLLGNGREPVPPAPPTATMTDVNTDDPASLTRVAAPGLALVIVGLLGLGVVRRLGRPRP